jgi:exopolysaccharide production protein ExoQ
MHAFSQSALFTPQTTEQNLEWTANRVGGLGFWIPTLIVGVAYLSQHRLMYASADSPGYDQVADLVAEAGGSNLLRQLSFLAIGLLGAMLLVKPSSKPVEVAKWLLVPWLLYCLLMAVSCIWADDSMQSLKRSMVPLLMTVAALGVGKFWNFHQLLLFAVAVTFGFLLLGFSAECVGGTFAFGNGHRFCGTQHPNAQAVNCALLALASFALFAESRQREGQGRLFWLLLAMVGVTFLLLTRSRTATVAFGVALTVFLLQGASPAKKLFFCGLLVMLGAMLGVLWYGSDSHDGFLSAITMGRSEQQAEDVSSLTGRIPIWGAVLGAVADRPMLGYGYGGFWTPLRVEQFSSLFDWTFMHAHSAYLETLLNVGILGLALGLAVVGGTLFSARSSFHTTGEQGYRFVTALIVMALAHGFIDGNFAREGFETFLVAAAIATVIFHRKNEFGKVDETPLAAFSLPLGDKRILA